MVLRKLVIYLEGGFVFGRFRWIVRLNVVVKFVKVLEENVGVVFIREG